MVAFDANAALRHTLQDNEEMADEAWKLVLSTSLSY